MKILYQPFIIFILILLFFNLITNSNEACDSDDNPTYKGDCTKFSGQDNIEKCCYIQYKVNGIEFGECTPLLKAEWKNFGTKFNNLKTQYEEKNSKEFKLDCKSLYINYLKRYFAIVLFLF